jgi:hypothetical protein
MPGDLAYPEAGNGRSARSAPIGARQLPLMIFSSEGCSLPEGNFPYKWDIRFRAGAGLPLAGEETRTMARVGRQILAAFAPPVRIR